MIKEYRIEISQDIIGSDWEAYDGEFTSLDTAYEYALRLSKDYDYNCRVVLVATTVIIPNIPAI